MTASRRSAKAILTGVAVAAALLLSACSSDKPSASNSSVPAGPVVSLKLLMFTPMDLSIKTGTTVTWRNDEPISHTVTSGTVSGVDSTTGLRADQKPDGLFNTKLSGKGDTFSYTFTKPGKYSYYCDIHKGMNAAITVSN